MRKLSILIAVLFALACANEPTRPEMAAPVQTMTVRAIPNQAGVRYSATIEPDAQVALAFRVGGYVDQVNVEEGDRVTRGLALARVRQSDYREKVGQAAGAVREAEAALAQAQRDLERARALFESKSLTRADLDGAQARYDASRARTEAVRAAAGEAGLALGDTALIAPMDGVVLRRNVERGDLAAPGAPAFVIADTRQVKVELGVPDVMIPVVRRDDWIDVRTESLPGRTFRARVARIAPAADPKSRAFDVELHIDNRDDALKPGMVASLELGRAAEAPALGVPLAAVIRAPGADGYAVYVVRNDVVRAQPVDLGNPVGDLVTVNRGLRDGERVVVSGPSLLTNGQRVRVVGEALP